MKISSIAALTGVATALGAAPPLSAQCQTQRLLTSDGTAIERVSMDGDRAIFGAPSDDPACPGVALCKSGSAFLFERIGGSWSEVQKIVALDNAPGDRFGASVALSGDYAFVGAPEDDTAGSGSGSVYVYRRNVTGTWSFHQKLNASDGGATHQFGGSVSVDDTIAVVGALVAPGFDPVGGGSVPAAGAAYVFERTGGTWSETTKLTADDGELFQSFGSAVAVRGETVIVGASRTIEPNLGAGSAYVFEKDAGSWVQRAKLTASDGEPTDLFGAAVTIDGSLAAVGAPRDDDDGIDSGAVYVFRRAGTTWIPLTKLTASDAAQGDAFGSSVSMDDPELLVGAPQDFGFSQGASYFFHREGLVYSETGRVQPIDSLPGGYGRSVSFQGDAGLIVGNASAYDVSLTATYCDLAANPPLVSLSQGGTQILSLNACPSLAGRVYVLAGTSAGTIPGLSLGGLSVPLNVDGTGGFFFFSIANANGAVYTNTIGQLGPNGQATASFNAPAGSPVELIGLVLHHAYVVFDIPGTGAPVCASGAVQLGLSL